MISQQDLGVSKNRGGPPKWMVKIMENPMNKWMIWGYPYLWKKPYNLVWCCWWFRNPAFTSWAGSLSHYLQFFYIQGGASWTNYMERDELKIMIFDEMTWKKQRVMKCNELRWWYHNKNNWQTTWWHIIKHNDVMNYETCSRIWSMAIKGKWDGKCDDEILWNIMNHAKQYIYIYGYFQE